MSLTPLLDVLVTDPVMRDILTSPTASDATDGTVNGAREVLDLSLIHI